MEGTAALLVCKAQLGCERGYRLAASALRPGPDQDRVVALAKPVSELAPDLVDATLWSTDPNVQPGIRGALGWLHVAEKMEEALGDLAGFAAEARTAGIRHVVHMGMGGSSLAPLVFQRTFPPLPQGLPVTVLDTTDPATIAGVERAVPLAQTLFIVASKSGTTAEPAAFGEYFYARLRALKGERAGENFVAITDPGTPLVEEGRRRRYRRVFLNFPDIGGRSAWCRRRSRAWMWPGCSTAHSA